MTKETLASALVIITLAVDDDQEHPKVETTSKSKSEICVKSQKKIVQLMRRNVLQKE